MSMLPVEISEKDQIAIIAPHPDDEVIGVGGLLLSYPMQCTVILMTDGRHGDCNVEPNILKTRRSEEFNSVIKQLGARSIRLAFEDGTLLAESGCFEQVDFRNYTKFFLPCADDNHPDHMAACIYAKNKIVQQNGFNAEVYEYEVHLPLHRTTHYIDITDQLQKKKALISIYQSQMGIHDYPNQVCALASFRGYQNNLGGRYLETYSKMPLCTSLIEERDIEQERRIEKEIQLRRVLAKWLDIHISGLSISEYLHKNDISCIVIYGWGELGKKLYKELVSYGLQVKNVLDKNVTQSGIAGLGVYHPRKKVGLEDTVIVTVLGGFGEIKYYLEDLGYQHIYALDKIIDNTLFY